jgi:hypothetical protein
MTIESYNLYNYDLELLAKEENDCRDSSEIGIE